MPANQRVEDQAFGRTSRQGRRGTGQMLINLSNLISYANVHPNQVKIKRDLIETQQLNEFQQNDLKLIKSKDKLFKEFCRFLTNSICLDIREKRGLWDKFKSKFTYLTPSVYEANTVAAVEEQWAFFLHKLEDETITMKDSETEFHKLIGQIKRDYLNNDVIKNHYYDIVIGNDLIVNESKPKEAIKYFQKAVSSKDGSESNFYGAAYVGMAWCSILLEEEREKNKRKMLDYFRTALEILSNEMAIINSMQTFMEKTQPTFNKSDLYKQLNLKSSILGNYLNSIQNCVNVIKKSMRLINLVVNMKIIKNLNFDYEEHEMRSSIQTETLYFDLERAENKKVDIEWKQKATYLLTFNDLTAREDLGNKDQAIQTIEEASKVLNNSLLNLKSLFKSSNATQEYTGIRLRLKQVSLDRIKALLSQDKEFEELTYETAISRLKNERSHLNAMHLTDSYDTDLDIILSNGQRKKFKNMQINKLIDIIDNYMTDSSLRYDLIIKQSNINAINKYFKKNPLIESNLEVQFDKLNYTKTLNLLSMVKFSCVKIETVLKKFQLKVAMEESLISNAKVALKEPQSFEIIEKEELLKRVSELENDESPLYVMLENLSQNNAIKLVNRFKDGSTYGVTYCGIQLSEFWKILVCKELMDCQCINFCFDNLNKALAKEFIQELRKENFEFSLDFKNLNCKQTNSIIEVAHLEQELIEANKKKVKNLVELYMKGSIPAQELAEYAARGIEYLLEINEKQTKAIKTSNILINRLRKLELI